MKLSKIAVAALMFASLLASGATAQPPASTTVGVTALARPDALFEAEAIVMLAK